MPDEHKRSEASAVPPSLSFRQLQTLLANAHADPMAGDSRQDSGAEPQLWEQHLAAWSQASQQLLASLRQAGPAVGQGRSARQLMALGALQAHLAMALQAATASNGRERD
jgi:hypothetical protein